MTRTLCNRVVLALTLTLGASACDDLVNDSSFQLWCDDTPCAWEVEAGTVSRAPTWHEDDYGVSLDEDPTAISQVVPNLRSYACMRFEIITYNERGTELRLELDFDDDGVRELERTLDRSSWGSDVFYVAWPASAEQLRIRLVKYGPGRAIVAQIRAQGALPEEGCLGPSP